MPSAVLICMLYACKEVVFNLQYTCTTELKPKYLYQD